MKSELDTHKVRFLKTYVSCLTMEETVERIKKFINNKCKLQHVVINAAKIVQLYKDEKLRKIINSCPIINADGQSIIWAAKLFGIKVPERVTGIDLMYRLFKEAEVNGYKIYLLGAKSDVLEKAVSRIKELYPNIQIVGYHHGYFTNDEEIIKDINSKNPDILMVAMSSPKKEYWLYENIEKLNVSFCMGIGGSLDIIAGIVKRAPRWMQKMGLEWLYRFLQEPRRMWKRYIIGNIVFLFIVFKEYILNKASNFGLDK